MVLQHANVIRVVILGKKGVGKSGECNFFFQLTFLLLLFIPC